MKNTTSRMIELTDEILAAMTTPGADLAAIFAAAPVAATAAVTEYSDEEIAEMNRQADDEDAYEAAVQSHIDALERGDPEAVRSYEDWKREDTKREAEYEKGFAEWKRLQDEAED